LAWAIQLAAETARLKGDARAFKALRAASRNLPLNDAVAAYPDVLKQHAPDSFWHDWIAHSKHDDYWRTLKPDLTDVDLPMLHVGGWFDPYLTGDLRLFKEMVARSKYPQHFWVGPWSHIPWNHKVGDMDFGPAAMNPIDRLQIRWFDYWLKGKDTKLLDELPVHLFEMGSNQWRSFNQWPSSSKTQTYSLKSNGLAAMREDDGALVLTQPQAATTIVSDVLIHDPWRPVPALGGHASFPPGSFDRSALDGRSDILTYTTALFKTALTVVGDVTVKLNVQTDAASYDLCAVLSVVYPDNRVFNLTQGYKRINNGQAQPISLTLQPTCFQLMAGQALRLSLSAACFPAYTVNPGTQIDSLDVVPTIEHRIITLMVYQDRNTYLALPIPSCNSSHQSSITASTELSSQTL
jgi:putative CocE/NonD family hydrolase